MDINNLTKENLASFMEGGQSHYGSYLWTLEDVEKGIEKVKKYRFRTFIGPNDFIPEAKKRLAGTGIKVMGVYAPSGNVSVEAKKVELARVITLGADTCDGILNMTYIKQHKWDLVKREAEELVRCAKELRTDIEMKFIVEFGMVDDEELLQCAKIIVDAGGDILKMGSGLVKAKGIQLRQIELVHQAYPNLTLKGFAGDLSLAAVIASFKAGSSLIGSSSIELLLGQWDETVK